MPNLSFAQPAPSVHTGLFSPQHRLLGGFGVVLIAVMTGDAIMSYVAPLLIEAQFSSPLLMGLVMSTSSIFGLSFDFLAGRFFPRHSYGFFTKWLLLLAICFPLILLNLPHSLPIFIAAMGIWGVYYELIKFAEFSFVKAKVHHSTHESSWAFFEVLHSIGFLFGPVIASLLFAQSYHFPLAAAALLFFLGAVTFKLLLASSGRAHVNDNPIASLHTKNVHAPSQLHLWELIGQRTWPLLLFTFSLVLIDTAYMSVGTLLSEELKHSHALGILLLPAYTTPFLITPWFARKFSVKLGGKKRTAFLAGLIGGVLLCIGSLTGQVELLLLAVFVASLCFALAYPEMNATFEDFVVRVGKFGNSMIGLQNATYSTAYIVGPPLAGLIATYFGNQMTLTVFGGIIAVVSIVALVFTPRKVRMPQGKLQAAAF